MSLILSAFLNLPLIITPLFPLLPAVPVFTSTSSGILINVVLGANEDISSPNKSSSSTSLFLALTTLLTSAVENRSKPLLEGTSSKSLFFLSEVVFISKPSRSKSSVPPTVY
jgi:hypothetical protein